MSLVWMDGFESYGVGAGADISALIAERWTVYAQTYFSTQAGRTGGYAMQSVDGAYWMETPVLTTDATLIVHFAIYAANGYRPSDAKICSLYNGSTEGMAIHWKDAEFAVYKGGSLVATSSGAGLAAGNWYFLEFKVVTGSSGSYTLKCNGNTLLTNGSYDTRPGGTGSYHNKVRFAGGAYLNPRLDDVFIFDGAGSTNNDMVGDHRIIGLLPSGDGDASQFACSTGSTHYSLVDENPYNTTDYVEDDTTGHQDLYQYGDLSNIGAILGVNIVTEACVLDSTTFGLKSLVKLSGGAANADAGQTVTATSYKSFSRMMEKDPSNAAWTQTSVNAAQFGIEVG